MVIVMIIYQDSIMCLVPELHTNMHDARVIPAMMSYSLYIKGERKLFIIYYIARQKMQKVNSFQQFPN